MPDDALLLSRLQFAFTMAFHILFPAFTIGLASWLVRLEWLWLRSGKPLYLELYRFWLKIFAVSFALGVVSGIVMSFQFGTNWSRFAVATGNVLGPLLSYEVLTAFFLESTFLGIMLFGQRRVGRGLHFFATCMVALGTLISTFWIISANSWMHTPAGHEWRDGVFYARDWWAVVFNPSFPYRLAHMVLAAFLTTCFAVGGVAAWHLWTGRCGDHARPTLALSVTFAALVAPVQILAGDLHGLQVQDDQPAKLAAIEGHWESRAGAPLVLFALPDAEAETNRYELAVPRLGSLILTHSWNGRVTGLKAFPPRDRPPVAVVFWAFRIMVGVGLVMVLVGWCGVWLRRRGRLDTARWFHGLCIAAAPLGFVAVLAGWVVAEVGRQPWVVYGLLRTADAVSPVAAANVAVSLAAFLIVYTLIFGAGVYYLLRLVRQGPQPLEAPAGEDRRPRQSLALPAADPASGEKPS